MSETEQKVDIVPEEGSGKKKKKEKE